MLNSIITRNLKLNTLRKLTSIACFAATSQNNPESSFIKAYVKSKSALNKKSIDAALKMGQGSDFSLTARNQSPNLQDAKTLPKQSLLDIPFYKSKANFVKKLLVLIKLRKALAQSLTMNTREIDEIQAKTFLQNNGQSLKYPGAFALPLGKAKKLQTALLDSPEPIQRQGLKPFSTVTGFKKFMYNFVKLSQSQLQPGYNRRKYSHSHYNQTLKESTRLSRIYAYLPQNFIKNICGFAINPTLVKIGFKGLECYESIPSGHVSPIPFDILPATQKKLALYSQASDKKQNETFLASPQLPFLETPFSPAYFLRNALRKSSRVGGRQRLINKEVDVSYKVAERKDKTKKTNLQMTFHRPIPKVVNFLESRLDVILWRNQLASSIKNARQKLQQGIRLNRGLQKTTSYQTLPGDVFTFDK